MADFDSDKYLKDAIDKHPDLALNEQADTHAGVDGHIYIVRNAKDGSRSCVITTVKLGDKPEQVLKTRLDKAIEYLGGK